MFVLFFCKFFHTFSLQFFIFDWAGSSWLHELFSSCRDGAAQAVGCGLLIALLVSEQGLQSTLQELQLQGFRVQGLRIVAHGLCCPPWHAGLSPTRDQAPSLIPRPRISN